MNSWALPLLCLSIGIARVSAGGYNVLSVEPYFAEWCAAQFPDQLSSFTGYKMAQLIKYRDYVRIEPYLGRYCFEQFPNELKDQNLELTLQNMKTNHIQIEPYLMQWGEQSMNNPAGPIVDMESFVAEWCVRGQFRLLMSNPSQSLENAARNHVKIEPALGRWCFAQFYSEMSDLDEETTVSQLESDHVKVENEMIKWEVAVYGKDGNPSNPLNNKEAGAIGVGLGFLIALICVGAIAGLFAIRRHMMTTKQAKFQQEVAMTEAEIMGDSHA